MSNVRFQLQKGAPTKQMRNSSQASNSSQNNMNMRRVDASRPVLQSSDQKSLVR